jgi:DNA repair exonuclease SbcCD ATPase subunit
LLPDRHVGFPLSEKYISRPYAENQNPLVQAFQTQHSKLSKHTTLATMDTAGGGEHTDFDPPALFQLIRRVATDPNFQEFTKMVEEIPRLQQIIKARDELIARRNEDLKTQKANSDTTLRETQRLFNEDRYAANQEIKGLKEETKRLNDTVAQKEKTIKEMKSHEEGAKKDIENLKKRLKMETDKYNREVESKKDLNITISKMGFEFETLENKWEEEKGKTEKLEKARTSLENEKASLAEANQTLLKKQKDLDDLLEPLRDDDLDNSSVSPEPGFWTSANGLAFRISQFNLLWQDARRLIESYFRDDLPIQRLHVRALVYPSHH